MKKLPKNWTWDRGIVLDDGAVVAEVCHDGVLDVVMDGGGNQYRNPSICFPDPDHPSNIGHYLKALGVKTYTLDVP